MEPRLWDLGEEAGEKLEDVEGLPLGIAGQRVVVGRLAFIEESAGAFCPMDARERKRGIAASNVRVSRGLWYLEARGWESRRRRIRYYLRIDYLRPARGSLLVTARVIKVGRTLGVADVEVRDDEGRIVAIGRGTYLVTKP